MSTPPLIRPPYTPPDLRRQSIVITDIDMSIGAMCRFMIKWAIAAVPAAVVLWLFLALAGALLALVFSGMPALLSRSPHHP